MGCGSLRAAMGWRRGSRYLVEAGTYRFYIQNETFVKNLERGRGEAPAGAAAETFIGNILKPFIRFKISKEMKVDLGALLQIPFGDDDRVDQADPVVSFHYDFYPGYRFTAGTLDHIHPILDALFNDDLEFTDPVEQGFQIQARKKHFRQDIWFDWRERARQPS